MLCAVTCGHAGKMHLGARSTRAECARALIHTDAVRGDARAGRNGRHLLDEPLPGSPGVIDFDGHSDPDHGITCIRVEGDEVVTGEFKTTKDGTSIEGVWEKRRA